MRVREVWTCQSAPRRGADRKGDGRHTEGSVPTSTGLNGVPAGAVMGKILTCVAGCGRSPGIHADCRLGRWTDILIFPGCGADQIAILNIFISYTVDHHTVALEWNGDLLADKMLQVVGRHILKLISKLGTIYQISN